MSDDLKESKEELEPQEPRAEETGETSDEFVDEFADTLMEDPQVPSPEAIVIEEGGEEESFAEEEEFEEEKVKDEIDIQIDLLKDSDWVVRREAVVTLGEMADERAYNHFKQPASSRIPFNPLLSETSA